MKNGNIILAIILGLFAGVFVIFLVEFVSTSMYPPPPDLDMTNENAMAEYIASKPIGAKLLVILAWVLGAFAAGIVASLLGKEKGRLAALVAGGLLMIGGITNLLMLPHPWWFWVAIFLAFIPFAALGHKVVSRKSAIE